MPKYFGTYADFKAASKDEAAHLVSADNIVGDEYDIALELEDGIYTAWLDNRFGQRVGYFDPEVSRKLRLLAADGMVNKAILSFVAFSSGEDEGEYWGQAAIVSYQPAYAEEFENFIANVSERIAEDIRPKIDFDAEAVDKIVESNGSWTPTQTIPMPVEDKTMSILKRRRKMSEKMIEQGRAGNKGCYVASWAIILVVVAALIFGIFGIKGCLGF